jgi:alkanesulfonate monooxygenase SsuD/methylene tetrahydromethanopterin reductase-like flavin-dependent oxidoreductase (luciferase family)
MRKFRADMHRRLREYGRRPEDFKMLFIATPFIGRSDADAQEKLQASQAARWSDAAIEYSLFYMTYVSGGRIDFAQYDLDRPVSDLMIAGGNGERVSMSNMFSNRGDMTLREIAATRFSVANLGLVGSPRTVAAKMDELMQEVGGDGFLFYLPTTRMQIAEIADGLAPELQRRGSIRKGYDHRTLKENLLAF